MLSGWERFSKSRTIKEAKLAKNLKHRRFDYLKLKGWKWKGDRGHRRKGLRG
jgi:hypothetical protein